MDSPINRFISATSRLSPEARDALVSHGCALLGHRPGQGNDLCTIATVHRLMRQATDNSGVSEELLIKGLVHIVVERCTEEADDDDNSPKAVNERARDLQHLQAELARPEQQRSTKMSSTEIRLAITGIKALSSRQRPTVSAVAREIEVTLNRYFDVKYWKSWRGHPVGLKGPARS